MMSDQGRRPGKGHNLLKGKGSGRMRQARCSLLGLMLLMGLSTTPAWAHKVNLFAYVEGGTVYTESYFADGKKVEGCTIEVLNSGGTRIVEGKTDAQGHFSFPLGKKETLTIVINAGMGHKNSFVLKREEM
jgi:nickel transport protein